MIKEQPQTLSKEYVMEHGVLFDEDTFAFESYWENEKNHYEQLFDKPMNMGGKPFNGLIYELYPNGELLGYTFYENGYHYGDDVEFYEFGSIRRFSHFTELENYICSWYPNGNLKFFKENHRRDVPYYHRTIEFDETGNPQKQCVVCEILFTYDYISPDKSYNVEWYDNGEFKKITTLFPTNETLYTEIEFDLQGYPLEFKINPYYCPNSYSAQSIDSFYKINRFNKEYHFEKDILFKRCSFDDSNFIRYSGRLVFMYFNGKIKNIMEYHNGIQRGAQYTYYLDGQIKEFYCISKGREYNRHIYWNKQGIIEKLLIYSKDGLNVVQLEFDKNGKLIYRTQIRRK